MSTGGGAANVKARMNVTVTSEFIHSAHMAGGGANLNWQIHSGSALAGVVGSVPSHTSDSACFTSPWVTVPVGSPVQVLWGVEGGAIGAAGNWSTNTVTQSPGCGAVPFIEIDADMDGNPDQGDYTYESEKLGITGGEFPAVPALSATGLIGLAGTLLAVAGVTMRRRPLA